MALFFSLGTKYLPSITNLKNNVVSTDVSYSFNSDQTVTVVEKANKAVVSIIISKDISQIQRQNNFSFNGFFDLGFPFNQLEPQTQPQDKNDKNDDKSNLQRVGGGSGFIISSDGLIVTNRHVVDDEDAVYSVALSDGTEYDAEVLAKDPVNDVALLKIEAKDLPTLELGDSDQLKIGQTVIAIGNALAEYGNTVTRGVVSGKGRRVEAGNGSGSSEVLEEAIQTDAAINPGNSGGPLLDMAGNVIGINTAVSQEGQLVGFAIPINSVKKTIQSVRETGKIVRPWLGIRYTPINKQMQKTNNLSVDYGVIIQRGTTQDELAVIPGSPADKAGLVENDIILEFAGQKIDENHSLVNMIGKYNIGDEIEIKILHKGNEKTIKLKLEQFPDDVK
ncbi:MAG: hypothetical protein COX80_05455 [Candidatus Magasanikbacteria bacterium CG_4_10_14_0_2_um_filter_33_14]|uniref:PDZ domain-containing protein n=1 Tax=Candidatus Magasanikbacteria bacterium CG_4_10_14_0_2_um_filter_33_14 TaxID=1974636 RepID=A0A2M7V898_9BACT|nr:MAG: hypothetical protein COX80_05455 [Candidatus Magasanikbacteria bacterium CG_4_10_14_0_2_um_filter_33_14]